MNRTDEHTGSSRRFRKGLSWDHPSKPVLLSVGVGLLLVTSLLPARAQSAGTQMLAADAGDQLATMIVRELPGSGDAPERAVARLGGQVGRHIGILDAFVAQVPQQAVATLAQAPGVAAVTPDAEVRLLHHDDGGYNAASDHGSMYAVAQRVTGAGEYWNNGFTGRGVDVAVIDSGVVPVDGLTAPGKVLNGADLSFESQSNELRHMDTYGHGTHMAGIIAGRDDAVGTVQKGNSRDFIGMAPGARIVSIKVADDEGATDVSQVLAAIDWVVAHRRDSGMNIRVLNLSFGTDGVQDYVLDPLAYVAEVAWRKGIVVVVAAGNRGFGTAKLNNPAYNPHVLAVGATASNGTYGVSDDTIPSFSSCGDGQRNPDLVAPGKSIVSLRTPNSTADVDHPEGRVGSRFFRGSGTSQAAAVVSGAAALVIQQRPSITPDQVKALLTSTATPLPAAGAACQGAGLVNLKIARDRRTPTTTQQWTRSTGLGSLDAARGSARLIDDGDSLNGERDIFGSAWDATRWARDSLNEDSWSSRDDADDEDDRVAGGMWNGKSWSGDSWSGSSWSGSSWSGKSWSDASWSGKSWSDASWSGKSWSGKSWSEATWTGKSWSGSGWTDNGWSESEWQ